MRPVKSRRITIMELSASRRTEVYPSDYCSFRSPKGYFKITKSKGALTKDVNVHKLQENLNKRHDYQIVSISTTHESLKLSIVQMTSNFLRSSSLDSRNKISCKLITKTRVIEKVCHNLLGWLREVSLFNDYDVVRHRSLEVNTVAF